ncbi:MAG: hypothetical protein ACREFR_17785 [Limisphaerales bacterium]
MQTAAKSHCIRVKDHLVAEENSDARDLYSGGVAYAMAGETVFCRGNRWRSERFSHPDPAVALSSVKLPPPPGTMYAGV